MTPAEIAALQKKLPFELQTAVHQNPRTLLLYGAPKVGKSHSVAALSNAVIIPTERGADKYNSVRTPPVLKYDDLITICDKITAAGRPYKYVVLDTIDSFEKLCFIKATENYRNSPIGKNYKGDDVCTDLPEGAGYLWLRRAMMAALDKLFRTTPDDGCVILLGHVKDKFIKDSGKDASSIEVDLTGKLAAIVCAEVDAIGHMTRRTRPPLQTPKGSPPLQDLFISFKTSELVNCGSNCAHLKNQDMLFAPAETQAPNWGLIFH